MLSLLGNYLYAKKSRNRFLPQILMIKESCNLIGWEHFGLTLWSRIFPDWRLLKKTANCKVFHLRLLPATRNDKTLWKSSFFANYRTIFLKKFTSVTFFVSKFHYAIFLKKLIHRLWEKLVTNVLMCRQAWIRRISPAGSPKMPDEIIKYTTGKDRADSLKQRQSVIYFSRTLSKAFRTFSRTKGPLIL